MALQAAAGVAMHLGHGEQALSLAEQVHRAQPGDRHDERRGDRAAGAGAGCQAGDVDEAMAAIEQIDVADFPFGLAPGPSCGPSPVTRRGRADAEAVERARGASYFDLAVARLGGVLAADRAGDAGRRAGAGPSARRRSPRPSATSVFVGRRPAPARPARRRRRRIDPPPSRPAGAASSTRSSSAEVHPECPSGLVASAQTPARRGGA